MDNDPELDGKYLGAITQDFVKVADLLKEASYQVRKRGFSDYPIFPVAKTDIPIGQLLYKKEDVKTDRNYYITYVDEFVDRKIIDKEGLENFKRTYKDPDEFCCLFVVEPEFTKFLFVPFPED